MSDRQSRSFDGTCSACKNDALQRLALIREDSLARHLQLKQFYENAQNPEALRRQDQPEFHEEEDQARYFDGVSLLWPLESAFLFF